MINVSEFPLAGQPIGCTGCGKTILAIGRNDLDDLYCGRCNDRFYDAMAAEFPYGQCGTCGAAGQLWLCPNNVQHVTTMHVEGMCGQWSDREPEYDSHGRMLCDLCPRVYRPADRDETETRMRAESLADCADDLPF